MLDFFGGKTGTKPIEDRYWRLPYRGAVWRRLSLTGRLLDFLDCDWLKMCIMDYIVGEQIWCSLDESLGLDFQI